MVTKNPLDILAMGDNVTEKALYIVRVRESATDGASTTESVRLNVRCSERLTLNATSVEMVW